MRSAKLASTPIGGSDKSALPARTIAHFATPDSRLRKHSGPVDRIDTTRQHNRPSATILPAPCPASAAGDLADCATHALSAIDDDDDRTTQHATLIQLRIQTQRSLGAAFEAKATPRPHLHGPRRKQAPPHRHECIDILCAPNSSCGDHRSAKTYTQVQYSATLSDPLQATRSAAR